MFIQFALTFEYYVRTKVFISLCCFYALYKICITNV